jgi:Rrf2 family transcriptional regulator, iron-sulfur cluster assembly transcription factor
MKLSTQEEYGLRCLLRLGRRPDASLTIPEISQAEGLSTHNAAKILRILRRSGFIASERGQHGGYSLARPPRDIIVGEVLSILGGRLYDPSFCNNFSGADEVCQHSSIDCSVRSLWMRLQEAVDEVISQTTLQDLLQSGQEMSQAHSPLLEVGMP